MDADTKVMTVSKEQRELIQYLVTYTEEHGYQPSRREMADEFDININAVNMRLHGLANKGLIVLTGLDRGILIPNLKFRREYVLPEEAARRVAEAKKVEQLKCSD